MKTVLLFSGQGSQYIGMVKDLVDLFPIAKEITSKADDILNYGLSQICFEGPEEVLKETRNTQPSIFLHSAILLNILDGKINFDAVAGHSVGEYAALLAAGVISFNDGLKLTALRGMLMFEAGKSEPGTMFAVINLNDDKVEEVCQRLTAASNGKYVVAANYNSPGQVVVSGSANYLRENANSFKEAGARLVKELSVSGAFHSPLMEPAKEKLRQTIISIEFTDAKVPVYVNYSAKPLTKAQDLKNALIEQLTSPVLWTQTIRNLQNDGFVRFVEIGPGNVLQGLVKRTLNNVVIDGIDKAGDLTKYF